MHDTPRIILFIDASRGYGRRLLSGIARYSALHGPWSFYRKQPSYLAHEQKIDVRELRAWRPNGIICSIAQARELQRMRLPMVGFDPDTYAGKIPCMVSDHAAAGHQAALHLLGLGHHNFAYCGFDALRWSRVRCEAFCRTVEAAGAHVHRYESAPDAASWAKEEPHLQAWIQSLPKPIGIFCANDDRAEAVIDSCHTLAVGVPEDISILGADDDANICSLANPPLSSVRIASDQAGFEAARLLHQMIRGEAEMAGQRIVAPVVGVTSRQSTDVLMVENKEVRKALRFIRENANRPIRVSDVVDATALSHRSLNEQFHAALGGSIVTQLTRARIDFISELLTDSDLRIQEIAQTVGYEDDRHFARYFKRATGLTPQEHRRKMAMP
ncbi:MAG: DNA-binding transcriptional regulator [Verrucomicrobia bacterium]|jgi:LacI family transcriptional regulator|nr:DNA-binding transcriptional regulator [Verrucomicrobiota bacterium]